MFETANYIEAGLWAVIGSAFLLITVMRPKDQRARAAIAGVAFLLFGVSDVVEARTGAWWRPWWLLAWKGLCLAVLFGLLREHLRRRSAPTRNAHIKGRGRH